MIYACAVWDGVQLCTRLTRRHSYMLARPCMQVMAAQGEVAKAVEAASKGIEAANAVMNPLDVIKIVNDFGKEMNKQGE